ncbi:transcriptional regulator [Clostridium sp.]|uniref:transcriptional regulator n=1 Tax=Clostridium sp. TaxID=1506 RepID=UPI001ECF1933|nr:transcriptional regulator [Clostridium sp.]MBS5886680.1 transcriptional regulator [Clostridium sp.]
MDKELFRKTEGKLYRYYESKKKIYGIKEDIARLEREVRTIEYDIRHSNVTIDYYQNGTGIQERVQSSSTGTSYAENEMCKQIERLEKEHVEKTKKILKNRSKIRDMERYIDYMDRNIRMLQEEDKRFLELKYGDKKNILQISMRLNMAQATAYRKREELVEAVAEYENMFLR